MNEEGDTRGQSGKRARAYRLEGAWLPKFAPLGATETFASKKLLSDGVLVPAMTGTGWRFEFDKTPFWLGPHGAIRQPIKDFARYSYLPRLKDSDVLYQRLPTA